MANFITDWLMYTLHFALVNVGGFWIGFIIFLCIVSAFLTYFIGAIRWWTITRTHLPELWAKHRREMRKEINEQKDVIEKQKQLIFYYRNRAFKTAIKKVKEEADLVE